MTQLVTHLSPRAAFARRGYAVGTMLLFSWNRLVGSYAALIRPRRCALGPYIAVVPLCSVSSARPVKLRKTLPLPYLDISSQLARPQAMAAASWSGSDHMVSIDTMNGEERSANAVSCCPTACTAPPRWKV